jgi:hypothetical protein
LAGVPPVSAIPPVSGRAKTSELAIASLICGILGLLCPSALVGLVLGTIALVKISRSGDGLRGRRLAISGLAVSGAMLTIGGPAGLLLSTLERARLESHRVVCGDNLKQIALAGRLYSADHRNMFPPDFLAMSNELNSPKILFCPDDKTHSMAESWAGFDSRVNLRYEYLRPGIKASSAMSGVIFGCPIHNPGCMGDGFIMKGLAGSRKGPRQGAQ